MSASNYSWAEFSDKDVLANQLADDVVIEIEKAIELYGSAVIALSGGSTPMPFFKALSSRKVDWSNVIVTLVDERWVNESHELSNAAFLKRFLMDELNSAATFIPLFQEASSVEVSLDKVLENYCDATESSFAEPRPFDVVILGMGNDGHTASFFPDAQNIADLVDPSIQAPLLTCNSPSTQVERVTWSLARLLSAPFLALHITGETKQAVFERALEMPDATVLPISAIIFQNSVPLNIYYSA